MKLIATLGRAALLLALASPAAAQHAPGGITRAKADVSAGKRLVGVRSANAPATAARSAPAASVAVPAKRAGKARG